MLGSEGVGCIAFSPLAQGLLTDRYLDGMPARLARARGEALSRGLVNEENLDRVRALDAIAARRGQTLAQMAMAWTLRDPRVTSALLGASSVSSSSRTSPRSSTWTSTPRSSPRSTGTRGYAINIWERSVEA